MSTQIFVNLPVKDLNRSMDFFTRLGYSFNKQFTDENAASMVISPDIYAMLLTEEYFATFTSKKVADAATTTEAIIAIGVSNRSKVDEIADAAAAAGGTSAGEPKDHGFMYTRSFEDPDGHIWEFVWMDPDSVEPQP
jgi:predicted lactoylglutathione lyase